MGNERKNKGRGENGKNTRFALLKRLRRYSKAGNVGNGLGLQDGEFYSSQPNQDDREASAQTSLPVDVNGQPPAQLVSVNVQPALTPIGLNLSVMEALRSLNNEGKAALASKLRIDSLDGEVPLAEILMDCSNIAVQQELQAIIGNSPDVQKRLRSMATLRANEHLYR